MPFIENCSEISDKLYFLAMGKHHNIESIIAGSVRRSGQVLFLKQREVKYGVCFISCRVCVIN